MRLWILHAALPVLLLMLLGGLGRARAQEEAPADAPSSDERPNILFIIADDLNDAVEGLGGHPQAKTPNLKRLMARGVTFANAQVNVPICGPSRASLLTGLYPHTTGYYGYNFVADHWRANPTLRTAVTFLEYLRAFDYEVLTTGKLFHNNQEDPIHGVERGIPPSWGPWPWGGTPDDAFEHGTMSPWRTSALHPDMPEGFGIDDQFGSLKNVPDVPADTARGVPGYEGWRLFFEPFRYKGPDERDLMPDELNAQWAAAQIEEGFAQPFLMAVGFNRPHSPMFVPQAYLDRFPLDEIELARNRPNDLSDVAEAFKGPDAAFSTGGYGYYKHNLLMEAGGEAMLRRWTQAYLASVAFVDDQLGTILDALEASPYAENTYVVFTSDHGYHMGEKAYVFKNSVWEESMRVPLVVAGPGVAEGAVAEQPVTLVDLFPTFADWAGVPGAAHGAVVGGEQRLDGHSLRPLLEDPQGGAWSGPEVALSVVASGDSLAMGEPGRPERQHWSVRSTRYRYIRANTGAEELYDHATDPHEWTNVADRPAYAEEKARLRNALFRLTGMTPPQASE